MATDPRRWTAELPEDVVANLIDLRGLTLRDLEASDRSTLGLALRRLLARQEDQSDPVVAFQSAI